MQMDQQGYEKQRKQRQEEIEGKKEKWRMEIIPKESTMPDRDRERMLWPLRRGGSFGRKPQAKQLIAP